MQLRHQRLLVLEPRGTRPSSALLGARPMQSKQLCNKSHLDRNTPNSSHNDLDDTHFGTAIARSLGITNS